MKRLVSADELVVINNRISDIYEIPLDDEHHNELIAGVYELIGTLHAILFTERSEQDWDITK